MNLILDNNIFFSLLNPASVNSYLFSSLNIEFFSPEYIKSELEEHKSECLEKSNLSEQEFELRKEELESKITFIQFNEYKQFLKQALLSLPDPEDSPYIALALHLKSPIWSNDSHLKKQALIKIYTTKELIDKLLNNKM